MMSSRWLAVVLVVLGVGCSEPEKHKRDIPRETTQVSRVTQTTQEKQATEGKREPEIKTVGAAEEVGATKPTSDSGVKYEDIRVGSGPEVKKGDFLVVHYTGWLAETL